MKTTNILLAEKAKLIFETIASMAVHSKMHRSIHSSINRKIEILRLNFQYGDPIAKNLIPKIYSDELGITNLFRIELPSFWRMLYTVRQGQTETEIDVLIIDILDHKEYDGKFGYKRK